MSRYRRWNELLELLAADGQLQVEHAAAVLGVSAATVRRDFDELAMVWLGQLQRKPRWIASKTAEMVNHVRNNMFHGVKVPDDRADRELVEHVNSLLLGILDALK